MSHVSRHAMQRCRTRCISRQALDAALEFGQRRSNRGAVIYTLGWRQIRTQAERGVDLSRFEGIEVIESHDGTVLTVYRNSHARAMRDRSCRKRAA